MSSVEISSNGKEKSNGLTDNASEKQLLKEPVKNGNQNLQEHRGKENSKITKNEKTSDNEESQEMKLLKTKNQNGDAADKDTIVILEHPSSNGKNEEKKNNNDEVEVHKKKNVDAKCLLIGLMVLVFMVVAAIAAILAHNFNDHHTGTFKFAHIFSNHMVLQGAPFKSLIWGYVGSKNENATVVVMVGRMDREGTGREYHTTVKKTAAGMTWSVLLDEMGDNFPYDITATIEETPGVSNPNNQIKITDVLFGDVWMCVGDEKLTFPASKMQNKTAQRNSSKNIKNNKKSNIRLFSLNPSKSDLAWFNVNNVRYHWSRPEKEIKQQTSRICLDMVRNLNKQLKKNIGLISSIHPFSSIDQWMPAESIKECPTVNEYRTGQVWNTMMHPLLQFATKGLVWYQGELDARENPHNYNCSLHQFFTKWTQHQRPHPTAEPYPIALVQLPSPANRSGQYAYNYADLRWKQTFNYGFLPNPLHPSTILIPTIDFGTVVEGVNEEENTGPSQKNNFKVSTKNTSPFAVRPTQAHTILATRLTNAILSEAYEIDTTYDNIIPTSYRFKKKSNVGGDGDEDGRDEDEDEEVFDENNDIEDEFENAFGDENIMETKEESSQDGSNKSLELHFGIELVGPWSAGGSGIDGELLSDSPFEICCSNNKSLSCSFSFPKVSYAPGREWLEANIISTGSSIILDTSSCEHHVVGVRYLWRDVPCVSDKCPLYSKEGLPMSPFIRLDMNDEVTEDFVDFSQEPVHLM